MAVLVIRHLPPDTHPDAVVDLLRELGYSEPVGKVTLCDGSGQPWAVITLPISRVACVAVAGMLNGRFWNGQVLEAEQTHVWRE
ncbi:hypothetical protein SAMN02745857_02611 [Andreprevotia lacus DSM 23236]|jgi:hypothetical protein|uniref:RNA-binding protein n=1 Tax=Andreprevotia lacus DSM 23236 TaxID=1121001 RepID=A0A1W1XTH2_9NEIS|nr:hypothetical protein [Andreprevotia lacus]SMC26841.1 hypothetical protein SAMN02745857_02611 [Andreprevotia lacus DSM 23236]